MESVRLERLEEDADVSEAGMSELGDKVDALSARINGMIVATASAAVLLAANLVVGHLGH